MNVKLFEEPRRFWSKVDVGEVDECWEWQAYKRTGYGQFRIRYRTWQAHRVAWILTYGPIPEGLCVCHKCDNRGCCNPYHLFLGTDQDNQVDSARKGRQARKLTEQDVLSIRDLYTSGKWTQKDLADEFGVHSSRISSIIRGTTWGWLDSKEESDEG